MPPRKKSTRAVTISGTKVNKYIDSGLQDGSLVMVPTYKITRSKSSSFVPGLNYKSHDDIESNVSGEQSMDPQIKQFELNDSPFNETLILAGSPSKSNTVLRRDVDEHSFGSNESQDLSADRYKISAISPLSKESKVDVDPEAKVKGSGKDKEKDKYNGNDNEQDNINDKHKSNTPPETPKSPLASYTDSIMDPLRGEVSNHRSNSIFKEQSALEETIEEKSPVNPPAVLGPLYPALSYQPPSSLFSPSTSGHPPTLNTGNKDPFEPKKPLSSLPLPAKYKWLIAVLVIFISLLLGGFIPSVVILSRGTSSTVKNYFKNTSPGEREQTLRSINSMYKYEPFMTDTSSLNKKDDPELFSLLTRDYDQTESKTKLFKGVCYSPLNSMEPQCGNTRRNITLDMALLSTITKTVKNYGMQCNQSEFILDAIQELGLNMTLAMGVWIGDNDTINQQQLDLMKEVLVKYPRKLFDSVYIGNEVLFREEKTEKQLISIIKLAKKFVNAIGYFDLPVGTSEIGSLITPELINECDIIGANVHPFFGGMTVDKATDWTVDFVKYEIKGSPSKKIVISEVGWPYKGGNYQASVANSDNFQHFLNHWLCDSKVNKYDYYYFEAFDEPWKQMFYEANNTWETEWGIFDVNKNLKFNITFPKCW